MSLQAPWMLAFLVSLPVIVLFYLLKRTYENTPVPSILLWQTLLREMEANRPWQKLRRNLLLLLQLLLAALLAFALARPAVTGEGPTSEHTIAVLDLSPSMAAAQGEDTRLNASKQQIGQLIDALAPNQRLTLISMGREARVLAAGNDLTALEQALDQAPQEYGKADYEGALSLAAALSAQDPAADVFVFSDGNWSLDAKLLPRFARSPRLILPPDAGDNLSIRHAAAVQAGEQSALVATVVNNGAEEHTVEVQVQDAQGQVLDAQNVQVAPGRQEALTWNSLPVEPSYQVVLTGADGLAADNRRTVLPARSAAAKAWVVSASGGNLFLEKSLSLGGTLTVERGTDPNAAPADAALYVYDGVLPDKWPDGAVLVVNPPGDSPLLQVSEPLEPGPLKVLVPDSPLLQHVDLSKLHLQAVRDVLNQPWLQPVVSSGDTPLLLRGEREGRRMAVLPFDLHQSDLPLLPAFPILMKHLQADLLPVSGGALGEQTAGERVLLLPPVREIGWQVTGPDGKSLPVDKSMVEQGFRPSFPGLYRFTGGDGSEERLLAVTMAAEESHVQPTQVVLPSGSGQEVGNQPAAVQNVSGQREIWRYVAMAMLLLLFVEWGVYRRGN